MIGDIMLTVDKDGPADAGRFFSAGVHLLALLDALSENASVEWQVADLRTGSAISEFKASQHRDIGVKAAAMAVKGLRLVREGEPLPPEWTPEAVVSAQMLANGVDAHSNLQIEDDTVWFDDRLRALLRDQSPWVREFYGSIRGQLTGVNVTRTNRASIKPQGGGKVVHVAFPRALAEEMKEGLLQFVEVDGTVRQDADGRNYYIRADHVHVFNKPAPKWRDIRATVPEITDGMTVDDYLKEIRGESE